MIQASAVATTVAISAAAAPTRQVSSTARAVQPLMTWLNALRVNQGPPCPNSCGEKATSRNPPTGSSSTAANTIHGSARAVLRSRAAARPRGRGAAPAASGTRGRVSVVVSVMAQCTIVFVNQVLMVPSCGPQV